MRELALVILVGALICLGVGFLLTTGVIHGSNPHAWVEGGLFLGFSSVLLRPLP